MKSILWHLHIIRLLMIQNMKQKMVYRLDFLIGMLGGITITLTRVVTSWILFQNIPQLNGWTFYQMLFFLGFFQGAMVLHDFCCLRFWSLSQDIRSGDFLKFYFRPINMMVYYATDFLNFRGALINLITSIILMSIAGIHLDIIWNIPRILLFILNWFSAALIIVSILVGGMTASFWVTNSGSLTMTLSAIRDHSYYPLTIFSKVLQTLFTFILPIGFITYYPCLPLLLPIQDVPTAAWFSPLVGPLIFSLVYLLWKKGVSIYSGTGS